MSVLPVAFIESIGGGELMLVLVIALMLFGGDKLPELARGMGKAMREFKKTTGAMQDELRKAMEEVENPPPAIMPPRPVSPEIKSTPGIMPPGAEGPVQTTEVLPPVAHGSDPFMDDNLVDADHLDTGTDAANAIPPPIVAPAAPTAPLAADATSPAAPANPEHPPKPDPGPAV